MSSDYAGGMVDPKAVIVPTYHRKPKPWLLEQLTASIAANGYNVAYPIVIDGKTLVEGRHRLLAAIANNITAIPYVAKPQHVSPIRFGLQCNADGQLTAADDVFDLAELCWQLARDGWTGEQIAGELGWESAAKVSYYSNIKRLLHPTAWDCARLTKTPLSVNAASDGVVNSELTNVNWSESHFRSFLTELPYRDNDPHATMRAQVAAIRELLAGNKRTAKIAGEVARRHAWYLTLAQWMTGSLVREVGIKDRKTLLRYIRNNVYGKEHSDTDAKRFGDTLAALNERALGVKLYQDDALRRIPTLADGSISLVVTDPPYNVTAHDWDKIGSDGEYVAWLQEWLQGLRPKLAAEHHLFIFCDPDYAAPIELA